MKKVLYIFLISMVPVIELRAAIPIGAAVSVPWWICYLTCVIGNMLPVPFILIFIRVILKWMSGCSVNLFNKTASWLLVKAEKGGEKVKKYESLGLFVFVAVPLPGTGAWTGSLVAAILNVRMKYAIPSILAGVITSGFIMTVISYGVASVFNYII